MKSWRESLENAFVATAYAEAGDHATARAFAPRSSLRARLGSWIEELRDTFAAVAFAEAGLQEVSLRMIARPVPVRSAPGVTLQDFLAEVGLRGVPAYYGVARL